MVDFNAGHVAFGGGRPGSGGSGGTSGIQSLNGATGPIVTLQPGSGFISIVRIGNSVYLNASGSQLTCEDGIIWSWVDTSGSLISGLITGDVCFASGVRAGSGIEVLDLNGIIMINASGAIRTINGAAGPGINLYAGSGVDSIIRIGNDFYINTSGTSAADGSGLNNINGAIGPAITLLPGYALTSIVRDGNNIYINASGIDLTGSGFSTLTLAQVQSDLYTSGYVRNVDLLASGYVRSVNGLKNTLTIVGSGGTTVWTDGQTIQISASGSNGGGSGIQTVNALSNPAVVITGQDGITVNTIDATGTTYVFLSADLTASGFATYTGLHTSGYIRNVDFIQSGFITKAEVASSGFATRSELTTSGYLKASDRLYPIDARQVSGHIVPDTSGKWDLGTSGLPFNNIYAKSGFYIGSAIFVSGFEIPYRINSLAGPFININAGYGISSINTQDHGIYINVSGVDLTASGFATYSSLYESGYIRNVDFIQSGFITKAEVALSGFATRSELTTSGYLKASDRMYPVDARSVSGNIVPDNSGYWNLGSPTKFFHQIWCNSGIYQSGVSVSGFETIYKVNGLAGPFINIRAGSGVASIVLQDHDIFINTSGSTQSGSGLTNINGATGPSINIVGAYGISGVTQAGNNIIIDTSGFLTESGVSRHRRYVMLYDKYMVNAISKQMGALSAPDGGNVQALPRDDQRMSSIYETSTIITQASYCAEVQTSCLSQYFLSLMCDFKIRSSGDGQFYWGFSDTNLGSSTIESFISTESFAVLSLRAGETNYKFTTKRSENASGTVTTIPASLLPIDNEWHDVKIWCIPSGTGPYTGVPYSGLWVCSVDDKIVAAESGTNMPVPSFAMFPMAQLTLQTDTPSGAFLASYFNVMVNSNNKPPIL